MTRSPRLLVLYARADALGDGFIRLPALRAARTAFPDAHIVYGTSAETTLASALRRHVEGIIDEFRPRRSLAALIAELDPARGDATVVDFRSIAGWLVAAQARLLFRGVGYEANFPGFALSAATRGIEPRPHHNAWRFHRMIERLAGRALPFDHRVDVLDAARDAVRGLRQGDDRPLIVLAGNSARHKALLADQVAAVAEELKRRGYDVVYIHSPGEGPTGAELSRRVPGLGIVGPESGRDGVPLLEVILALGEAAEAFIGPEGGLAHCMAAVLVPMVVVNHGARVERWRPLSGVAEVVDARDTTVSGRSADIPPAAILRAFERLVAARDRDHPRASVQDHRDGADRQDARPARAGGGSEQDTRLARR